MIEAYKKSVASHGDGCNGCSLACIGREHEHRTDTDFDLLNAGHLYELAHNRLCCIEVVGALDNVCHQDTAVFKKTIGRIHFCPIAQRIARFF